MAALIGTTPGRDYTGAPASNVPVQSDLFLLFSGSVVGSAGSIEIHKGAPNGDLVGQPISGSAAIISHPSANGTYTEAQISFPGGTLDPGTQYYVSIANDAFFDDQTPGHVQGSSFTFTTAPSRPALTGSTGSISYAQGSAPIALAPNAVADVGSIALADLDEDGRVDLVSQNGSIKYNANTGSRTNPAYSSTPSVVYGGTSATTFALADLDADGLPDLLALQSNGGSSASIELFRNITLPGDYSLHPDPNGPPTPPVPQFDYSSTPLNFASTSPSNLTGFAFGDLTGDSYPDLVAVSGADLTLFVNSGSTSNVDFTSTNSNPFAAINTYNHTKGSSATVALGDINGDGKLDLVVGEADGSIVGFLQGTSSSSVGSLPSFSSTPITLKSADALSPATAPALAVADVTNDGLADIVYRDGTTYGYLQNTSGSAPPPSGPGAGPTTTPTPGPDLLAGTSGPDTIAGLAGDDTIDGVSGNDLILGNQGNDSISDGDGNSTIAGGMGNDQIRVGNGSNSLYGGEGSDTIQAGNGGNTIVGGTGNAAIDSLDGADLITSGSGNDLILGNGGDDTIGAGAGRDTVAGGYGNDVILGNQGDDIVLGNQGNDTLVGGYGNDTLVGGQGNDVLTGSQGDDVLYGNEGLNTFVFNPGDTDFKSGTSTGDTVADFASGTSRIDFASGPAGSSTNFGSASTTSTDFAAIQAAAQALVNGGATYAFVADGIDGFLFTTGGSGTTITDAVKLAGAGAAGAVKYQDIAHGALA